MPQAVTQPDQQTDVARLAAMYAELGPNARKVLLGIAERLVQGARDYAHSGTGDFDGKPRNWRAETLAECLDGMVYLTLAVTGIGATEPDRAELPASCWHDDPARDSSWYPDYLTLKVKKTSG